MVGTYVLQKSLDGINTEANVLVTLDWTYRHEIVAGLTITAVTWRILLNNLPSGDLTTSNSAIDPTMKMVQVRVTDPAGLAQVGQTYELIGTITLSDNTQLTDCVGIVVTQC